MPTPLDPHGQPLNLAINAKRRCERDVSELLGLSKGLLADGVVNDAEAQYLRSWGTNHPDSVVQWPLSLIFTRLQQFYADGHIDDTERSELRDLLGALIGGVESVLLGYEGASTLPLDDPAPTISWPQEVFVFTGKFAYGTRAMCEQEVVQRGGFCEGNITKRTSFLVIGTFGSEDWRQSSYGRKIERAVELRTGGSPIRLVGEDHWASALTAVA